MVEKSVRGMKEAWNSADCYMHSSIVMLGLDRDEGVLANKVALISSKAALIRLGLESGSVMFL